MKKRATGIGGVFLKAKDPDATKKWYSDHLGIKSGQWGGTFEWRHAEAPSKKGFTAWSIFDESTDYTQPGTKDTMINYRVENLEQLLKKLKKEALRLSERWRSMIMESSAGSWIPTAIKLSSGNRMMKSMTRLKGTPT